MGIEGGHEQLVPEDAEPLVDESAARGETGGRQLATIAPDLFPASRVDRPGVVGGAGHIEDVVEEQRGRLEPAERFGLKYPLRLEPADVLRRNLRQGTVALTAVVAAKHQPSA